MLGAHINSDDIDCIKAWAAHHAKFGGAPLSITGRVVLKAAKAYATRDREMFADACDMMEAIDDRYLTTLEPVITVR